MEARKILIQFLRLALAEKRDRICGFASKPRTEPKFLELLNHTIGAYFSSSVKVRELPQSAWASSAFAFIAPDRFGVPCLSLREAYESFGENEGALLISSDGQYGIWCDDTYVDERIFIAVKLSPNG